MTEKIGLFYGSSTCYTEMCAEKIQKAIGDHKVVIHNLAEDSLHQADLYSQLIMGIPTWDYGELQEDWEEVWHELDEIDWSQKTIAIYGLGDQIGYPEWFQDAMGYLYLKLEEKGARLIGKWPSDGYEFEASKALCQDGEHFMGLPLDEENEFDKSQERITNWCKQILQEFDGND